MKVKKLSETEYTVLDTVDNYRLKYNYESEEYIYDEKIEKNQNELIEEFKILLNNEANVDNRYIIVKDGNECDIRLNKYVNGKFISSELAYQFDFDFDAYDKDGYMVVRLFKPIYGGE